MSLTDIEDDRSLDAGHAWSVRELVERQILEMLGIAHDYVDNKVMASCD